MTNLVHLSQVAEQLTPQKRRRTVAKAYQHGVALADYLDREEAKAPRTIRQYVQGITRIEAVTILGERLGIGHVTPHQLRHTAITEAYEGTGDLRAAQAFARHEDPQVTSGYARFRQGRLIDITDRALADRVKPVADRSDDRAIELCGTVHVTGNETCIGGQPVVRGLLKTSLIGAAVAVDLAGMRIEGQLLGEVSNNPLQRGTLRVGRHNLVTTVACYIGEEVRLVVSRKRLRRQVDGGDADA